MIASGQKGYNSDVVVWDYESRTEVSGCRSTTSA